MKLGISGASGNVGKAVLAELARIEPQNKRVAISRTPEAIAAPIDGRLGDYDRPETLAKAYMGLDRLLIIPSADLRPGMRAAQAVSAIDAAVAAGVGHIFLLSAVGTREKVEPAMGAAYWAAEQRLVKSKVAKWTILRMNYFAETLVQEAQMALGARMLAGLSENRVAFIARDDVASALAGCLAGEGHVGAIYNLTGPASVTGAGRAALIAHASGKPLGFMVITEDQLRSGLAKAGLPGYVIDALATMQASFTDGAYDIVTSDVEKLSGRAPKPLEDVLAKAFSNSVSNPSAGI